MEVEVGGIDWLIVIRREGNRSQNREGEPPFSPGFSHAHWREMIREELLLSLFQEALNCLDE